MRQLGCVCLLFGLALSVSSQRVFLTSTPAGSGVSSGPHTATYTVSGSAFFIPASGPTVSGTFSGTGAVDLNADSNLPITVTLPGGTFTGTLLFTNGNFNNTNGTAVLMSQYGGSDGWFYITGGTGSYAGAPRHQG